MENWKTIHKEITVNLKTLEVWSEYVDFIHLNDEKISIRLILKKEKESKKEDGFQIGKAD